MAPRPAGWRSIHTMGGASGINGSGSHLSDFVDDNGRPLYNPNSRIGPGNDDEGAVERVDSLGQHSLIWKQNTDNFKGSHDDGLKPWLASNEFGATNVCQLVN